MDHDDRHHRYFRLLLSTISDRADFRSVRAVQPSLKAFKSVKARSTASPPANPSFCRPLLERDFNLLNLRIWLQNITTELQFKTSQEIAK